MLSVSEASGKLEVYIPDYGGQEEDEGGHSCQHKEQLASTGAVLR